MSFLTHKRLSILVPTIAFALFLGACGDSEGSLSKSEIEDGATKVLTKKVGQAPASFVCPGDLDAKVGESETCTLTDDQGTEYDTTVTITSISDDGSNAEYSVQVADQPKSSG